MLLSGHVWGENYVGRKGLWRSSRPGRWCALRPCSRRARTERHSCARRSTARSSGVRKWPREERPRSARAEPMSKMCAGRCLREMRDEGDEVEAEVQALLASTQMDQIADYLVRGRTYQHLAQNALLDAW